MFNVTATHVTTKARTLKLWCRIILSDLFGVSFEWLRVYMPGGGGGGGLLASHTTPTYVPKLCLDALAATIKGLKGVILAVGRFVVNAKFVACET